MMPAIGRCILAARAGKSHAMSQEPISVVLPKLREALRSKRLTQRGLADFLGTDESNISRLIRGKAKMLTPERIRKIEQYTGKSFEYLADLKSANLSEREAANVAADRRAPPNVQAAIDALLAPYRNL